jgi:hypothetical protein
VEAANVIQEAFKFTQPGSVLLLVTWLLYIVHGAICLPLLIMAQLLLLFVVEGHFLSQDVFVGDSQHFFWCHGILHGELADQGWLPQSLLEELDNRLVVNLQDDDSLVAKTLDKFLEWLSLLLDNVG